MEFKLTKYEIEKPLEVITLFNAVGEMKKDYQKTLKWNNEEHDYKLPYSLYEVPKGYSGETEGVLIVRPFSMIFKPINMIDDGDCDHWCDMYR